MKLSELTKEAIRGWSVLLGLLLPEPLPWLWLTPGKGAALLWLEIFLFVTAPSAFLWFYRNELDRHLSALKALIRPATSGKGNKPEMVSP